jgi:hypothetical protein
MKKKIIIITRPDTTHSLLKSVFMLIIRNNVLVNIDPTLADNLKINIQFSRKVRSASWFDFQLLSDILVGKTPNT